MPSPAQNLAAAERAFKDAQTAFAKAGPALHTPEYRAVQQARKTLDAAKLAAVPPEVSSAAESLAEHHVDIFAARQGYNEEGLNFDRWRDDAIDAMKTSFLLDDGDFASAIDEYDEAEEEKDAREAAEEERGERRRDAAMEDAMYGDR